MSASAATAPVLLLLRRELRLHDNPALAAAAESGRPVIPVFVLDDETPGAWRAGGAHRWWLHGSLTALAAGFERLGSALVLRRGSLAAELASLVAETGAVALHAGQPVEPWARQAAGSLSLSIPVTWHRTVTLLDPEEVRTGNGGVYGVFTPFANACRTRLHLNAPLPLPRYLAAPSSRPASQVLDSWSLRPTRPDWAAGLRVQWRVEGAGAPGEAGGLTRLRKFTRNLLEGYADTRNSPAVDGTSQLSPWLHWGELSPSDAWRAAAAADAGETGTRSWTSELLWREFSNYLLWHHPDLPEAPLRREFAAMPWRDAPADLHAWQRGRTGIPIVDAGMRQLWHIGWMHNRVRMIVASFLVKHLLLSWQAGAAWFWDTLVDADLASNSAQWQWIAGSGADAAPFFRVFNPVLQGRKFDPDGAYVRAWVPEIARLPNAFLHAPWEAPEPLREAAGVRLGTTYPPPIVGLAAGRDRALAAYRSLPRRAA